MSMVIREYRCAEHGEFECSDPICPAPGCRSQDVTREFRTAPAVRSRMVTQHDTGIRDLSERMGGADFRSAQQEGDTAYGGHLAGGMKWGQDAEKFLGHTLTEKTIQTDAMRSPAAVATRHDFVKRDNRPPFVNKTQHKDDPQDRKKVISS